MSSKFAFIFSLFLLAAWCPAPIKDIQSKYHELPTHTQAQVQAEQRFDGSQAVVGYVPAKTAENGTVVEATQGDADAKAIVAQVAPTATDPGAARVVSEAGKELGAQKPPSSRPWFAGLLVFGLGFGLFQAFRVCLERFGPEPPPAR